VFLSLTWRRRSVMCSRVLRAMVLLAALGLAMAAGAVLGGGAVYVLTRTDDVRPVVEVRTSDPWHGFVPGIPYGVPMWGAVVVEVVEDSPASAAGLREGDVITALDDQPVVGPGSLVEMIARRDPGDEVELTVYRLVGRVRRGIEVTLGEHPDEQGVAYLGVWLDGEYFGEFDSEFFGE
jgi:membrane-associated protease RseP (regulator of RpoE activity)